MKIKIFCLFLIFQFSISVSFAQEKKIMDLDKGKTAPFSGVLMTENLATELYLNSKFSPKECDIKLSESLGKEKIECDSKTSLLNKKLEIQKEKYETIINFKDNRINFLEGRWKPRSWYDSGQFWLTVGVFSGILITVASGYAIGQAGK